MGSGEAEESMSMGTTPRFHYARVVLAAVTLLMLAASGVRSWFGVCITPIRLLSIRGTMRSPGDARPHSTP